MAEETQDAQTVEVPPALYLIHSITGHGGRVDASAEQPDGTDIVRINDQWFFLDDCKEWEPR